MREQRYRFLRWVRALRSAGVLLVAACGAGETAKPTARDAGSAMATVESTSRATPGATATDAAAGGAGSSSAADRARARVGATPDGTGAPRVLFLGTSLTAGQGLDDPETDAYPAVLQRMADSAGIPARVVNAGLSGETSAGALRRADWLLREEAAVVVIETGANDGLRGLDPDSTAANIRALIAKIRAAHPTARVLLVQMEAPTNLGGRYTRAFHDLFGRVAAEERVTLLPFLLDGVAGVARLNQGDGMHPNEEGARRAARNVWPGIRRVLSRP